MELKEKLRAILEKIEKKKLSPCAFHIQDLVPTVDRDPKDISERAEWEYKIGDDVLKIVWQLEDMADDFSISFNDKLCYYYGWFDDDDTYENCWETGDFDIFSDYDEDAEELFNLIMQHGGVIKNIT